MIRKDYPSLFSSRQVSKVKAEWQGEIVRPAWKARRRLKPHFAGFPETLTEPLRRALVTVELDAEHIEQLHLAEMVPLEAKKGISIQSQAEQAV